MNKKEKISKFIREIGYLQSDLKDFEKEVDTENKSVVQEALEYLRQANIVLTEAE